MELRSLPCNGFDGAKPLIMKNNTLIRFVSSFVLLPAVAMSTSGQPVVQVAKVSNEAPKTVLLEKLNNIASQALISNNDEAEAAKLEEARAAKAEAIDAYFKKYDMPLAGTGMKMVLEAEKNDIDWRLLPAIAVRESTGGKHACKKVSNSFFGWGSCKINFKSTDSAIETVALNLGGNNPNTDHHYAGKTTKEILQKYNPPTIVPKYADQVMDIMDAIGQANIEPKENVTA